MKLHQLNEDILPQKLPVRFSSKIDVKISSIANYNQGNTDAISQWYEYIEGIKSYISNPAIAWDYTSRYPHFPNGAIYIRELGYEVAFIVKTNNKTNRNYVYVFKANLNPEEFGLRVPPTLKKNRQSPNRLTETYLCHIIEKSVKSALREHIIRRNRYNYHRE